MYATAGPLLVEAASAAERRILSTIRSRRGATVVDTALPSWSEVKGTVSGTKPRSGSQQRADWLRRNVANRERPWAFEEQLLAPSRAPARERRLAALTKRILDERTQLTLVEEDARKRIARLAALEDELHELVGSRSVSELPQGAPARTTPEAETPLVTVELGTANGPREREYWLCRCHGFRVETGEHTVGIVEGVRYDSSATRPDLIEVRARHFGRRSLLIIPVDEVEEIIEEEETLLVRASALEETDLAHTLLARLRDRFGHQVAT
jgi:hypothetical protein